MRSDRNVQINEIGNRFWIHRVMYVFCCIEINVFGATNKDNSSCSFDIIIVFQFSFVSCVWHSLSGLCQYRYLRQTGIIIIDVFYIVICNNKYLFVLNKISFVAGTMEFGLINYDNNVSISENIFMDSIFIELFAPHKRILGTGCRF